MKVAVCDDNENDLQQLSALLRQYDPNMEVFPFTTARALYESTVDTPYDAVILDIEMEAPNGYEIALRLSRNEDHPIILFATHSAAYAVQGYGIALRYLLKPLTADALSEAMDAVRRELRNNRLTVILDGTSHVLSAHDILYAEVANHRITIHTGSGKLSYRASLKDLMAQLPGRWFCMPHQSYVVNMLHVRTVSNQEIRMMDGSIIPVSRRKQQEFLQNFHRFLGV